MWIVWKGSVLVILGSHLVWIWNCNFGEEPLQLSSCPPDANDKLLGAGSESSARVLQKVKEIRRHVRLSCEGFEEELMALLTAIEASHSQKESAL